MLEGLSAQLCRQGVYGMALEAALAALGGDRLRESAYRAVIDLAARPKQAVAFLQSRFKPAPAVKADAAEIAKWIRDLDDTKFPVRDKAQSELAKLGEPVAYGAQ